MNARAIGFPLARCNKYHAEALREGGGTIISQCMSLYTYPLDVIVVSTLFSRDAHVLRG